MRGTVSGARLQRKPWGLQQIPRLLSQILSLLGPRYLRMALWLSAPTLRPNIHSNSLILTRAPMYTLTMHTLSHTMHTPGLSHVYTITPIHTIIHICTVTHVVIPHTHTHSQVHTITSSHKQAQSLQNSRNSPAPHPGILTNSCPTSQTQENHL